MFIIPVNIAVDKGKLAKITYLIQSVADVKQMKERFIKMKILDLVLAEDFKLDELNEEMPDWMAEIHDRLSSVKESTPDLNQMAEYYNKLGDWSDE